MTIPLSLLVAHYVGDFRFQSDWMATNKSKSWSALAAHCFVYSLIVGAFAQSYLGLGLSFTVVTFVTHFVTDAVTSRITSKLWFFKQYGDSNMWYQSGGNRHWFFEVIGIDQLIHYVTLAWTLKLLHN